MASTIKKRITLGFTAVLVLTAVMALTAFILLRQIADQIVFMNNDAMPGLSSSLQMRENLNKNFVMVFGHIIAKNPQERSDMEKSMAGQSESTLKLFSDYEKSISTAEDKALFEKVKEVRAKYADVRKRLLAFDTEGKVDEAWALYKSEMKPSFDGYIDAITALVDLNYKGTDNGVKNVNGLQQTAIAVVLALSAVVIVLGAVLAIGIVSGLNKVLLRITKTLDEGSNQVANASGQVSASSQSLAEGASEQAASIEETSASLTEISSMTERNAETAKSTKEFAAQTRVLAEQGAQSTEEMTGAIASIRSAGDEMKVAMDAITATSKDISNIIKTIDEIAFQTNLLALNAAVEAARAGEAGAGFAVVADEVRNLAQRSAKAAKETSTMIETALERSEAGVRANNKVSEAVKGVTEKSSEVATRLGEIVTKIHQVDEQVAQIAGASGEQSQGINQVSVAVSQMEKVTQSNASSAEESAAASEELNSQAAVLKDTVKELKALVG